MKNKDNKIYYDRNLLKYLNLYSKQYGDDETIDVIQSIIKDKYISNYLNKNETISSENFNIKVSSGKIIDCEFLLSEFLKSYRFYHSEQETIELMNDIINQKDIKILNKDLKTIGIKKLSLLLSSMVLKNFKNDDRDVDLTDLLPSIFKRHVHLRNQKVEFIKNSKIKRFVATTALMSIFISSAVPVLAKIKSAQKSQEVIKVESDYLLNDIDNGMNINDKPFIKEKMDNYQQQITIHSEDIIDECEKDKRAEILNNFKQCKTINDILKRQKELESLNLTKKDKIYKDCKLSAPLQRFIYEQSIVNGYPPDFTFAIIHTETRGNFNSSGTATYNAPRNYDLGLTQQNTIFSVKSFSQAYNVDYDKACKLVQHNDYVNVVSAFLEYQEIENRHKKFDPNEYAGCYNGWLNWQEKEISRQYVNIFNNAYNDIYTKYHHIEKVKTKK